MLRGDDEPMTDWSRRKLHFIAIGGAGMSGLALVCHRLGARVSGSDRARSSYLERLRAAGLEPRVGHDADAVPPDAEVVVSTAVGEDNPELARARERGQPVIHRGELLAELCAEKRLLAVAGTHGKTTTAGMLVHVAARDGRRPGLPARRRAAGRRRGRRPRERRLGRRRVGGRRGGRVRRELPAPAPRGGGGDQRRARPPLALVLARPAAGGLPSGSASRRGAWRCPATGASPAWRASSGSWPSTRITRARRST